jgi:hypothetical protein
VKIKGLVSRPEIGCPGVHKIIALGSSNVLLRLLFYLRRPAIASLVIPPASGLVRMPLLETIMSGLPIAGFLLARFSQHPQQIRALCRALVVHVDRPPSRAIGTDRSEPIGDLAVASVLLD